MPAGRIYRYGVPFGGTGESSSATNSVYDNSSSGLKSSTVQGAIDELKEETNSVANSVSGCIVTLVHTNWINTDGVYTYEVPLSDVTEDTVLHVDLYLPVDISRANKNVAVRAYDETITDVLTENGKVVFKASSKITVDLPIYIHGKVQNVET